MVTILRRLTLRDILVSTGRHCDIFLELHAFAIRDLIREEQVRLQWVDTKSNPADLLTKAVPSKALFDKFAKLIMGAVDDTAKVFLLSLRSVLVKERRRM